MSRLRTPICIVGAGPAGSSLALFLSRLEIPHVLVDKASFPRDKVCGDGLTLEVLHTLKLLGTELFEKFLQDPAFQPCWQVKATSPNGIPLHIEFDPQKHPFAPLYTGRRIDFDFFLWNQVRSYFTQKYDRIQVIQIKKVGKTCLLKLKSNPHNLDEIEANLVVGADGSSSIVARTLAAQDQQENTAFGIGIRAYTSTPCPQQLQAMEFHFPGRLLPGYFWCFPLSQNRLNLGVYLPANWKEKHNIPLPKLLDQLTTTYSIQDLVASPLNLEEVSSWGLPLNLRPKNLAGPNYLLLGDAGALVEPFTGKGIGMAMVSAKIASRYLNLAFDGKNNFSHAYIDYDKALKRMYEREYRISRRMYRSFSYPSIINTAAWLFSRKQIKRYTQKNLQKEILKWQC